eukprot:CAMPEP_0178985018 /NCGR_PEP_ID=MMETSP0795-20121207/1928_1 /TAXON_ID=88552 /ORGANISM="Amoebophrya sp., Strain Ameob2" /LENGTH=37 /DNA_ID= /DNA_START= /DNA_END= /DNA_ORIENTATION=
MGAVSDSAAVSVAAFLPVAVTEKMNMLAMSAGWSDDK